MRTEHRKTCQRMSCVFCRPSSSTAPRVSGPAVTCERVACVTEYCKPYALARSEYMRPKIGWLPGPVGCERESDTRFPELESTP
eukprot:scaffold44422_cov57-Phaeocystis_antarctica.AAC.5